MERINYHTKFLDEIIKGYVIIEEKNYFSELTLNDKGIQIRLVDFKGKINISTLDNTSFNSLAFKRGISHYLLFGLKLNEISWMHTELGEIFSDYSFTAQGFLYSEQMLCENNLFTNLSIHGEGIKKWSGYTRKLDNIMAHGLNNRLPSQDECVVFKKNIAGLGSLGLYYSYRYGGLNGLHTVGMEVDPHIKITFEKPVSFDILIEKYIDLYMLLRFLIGDEISISNIKTQNQNDHWNSYTQLYLAEKKDPNKFIINGMTLPYSSPYRDDSEESFPELVWENYFNHNNYEIKELIKKYVTYSMIHNDEEKFLGYYRILEKITLINSSYVDEDKLSVLLTRSKSLLSNQFPGVPLKAFLRAIKSANRKKHNTESCIQHFIRSLPESMIEKFKLKDINIREICESRNRIIHQPLFIETSEKIYIYLQETELFLKIALLIKLDVPSSKIEQNVDYC
ncbi:Uncharacterised protein [Yersinia rohdei]|uniref:ApeA N-terminal domain 1-containing protein n=1 Tax=Yersinia rohdei TaxID=29485 RepID=UPI0005DD5325|nr:hypothetical protein [Yersinia rohdei]CNI56026.1 Uncharacterised protein [Yersinia rohdei]